MANMEFIVNVSRYSAGVKQTKGSGYSPVLRISLTDPHVGAAKTTFDELKKRFPVAEGFKLDLIKREVVTTQVDSHP